VSVALWEKGSITLTPLQEGTGKERTLKHHVTSVEGVVINYMRQKT